MTDSQTTAASHSQPGPPALLHETRDANVWGIFAFGAGLFVTGLVVSLLVWLLFRYFSTVETRGSAPQYRLAAQQPSLPPEPRLQTHPREDLLELRQHEDEILNSYGWVDKNAGIVRIPIDEAMRLTVERRLPSRSRSDSAPGSAEVAR
jgi:hypothetical protein